MAEGEGPESNPETERPSEVEIIIPDFNGLHEFVLSASDSGKTVAKPEADSLRYSEGEGPDKFLTRQGPMKGEILSSWEIELGGGFFPPDRRWAGLMLLLRTPDPETSFDLVDKRNVIVEKLKERGLSAKLEQVKKDKEHLILIEKEGVSTPIVLYLGHETIDELKDEYPLKMDNNPIILQIGRLHWELSLEKGEFTKQLMFFQEVAPQVIEAMYAAFDYSPEVRPEAKIELSV